MQGRSVSIYSTSESHNDFYGFTSGVEGEPNAQNLYNNTNIMSRPNTHAVYVFVHKDTTDGTYAIGLWILEENSSKDGSQVTEFVGLPGGANESGYVFESGNPITYGEHGSDSYMFHSGEPVSNFGVSNYVFQSGTGLRGGTDKTPVARDDPPGEGNADEYGVNNDGSPYSDHAYGRTNGDGVMWTVPPGFDDTIILTANSGRGGYPNPSLWVGRGPNGEEVTKTAGSGTEFNVQITL
jgi:hypothetical protein